MARLKTFPIAGHCEESSTKQSWLRIPGDLPYGYAKRRHPAVRWLTMTVFVLCSFQLLSDVAFAQENPEDLPIYFTSTVKIDCQIPPEIQKSNSTLILWYRLNNGKWQQGGQFKPSDPIVFIAPSDGLYDLGITPADQATPPAEGDYRCMIDFNRPIVQIIDIQRTHNTALVRWRAYDGNYSDRPIEIYLQKGDNETLLGQYENSGLAAVPLVDADLPAKLKVIAVDRAGNYGVDYSGEIPATIKPVRRPAPTSQPAAPVSTRPTSRPATLPADSPLASNPEANYEYQLARTYQSRGDLTLAQVHYKRAIQFAPQMIAAYVDLADVISLRQRYNEAVEFYLQALDLDGNNLKALCGLGMARLKMNQPASAAECLEKVVGADAGNLSAWIALGDAHWTLGRKDDAKAAWFKAKNLARSAAAGDQEEKVNSRLKMIE